ncbi:MAG: SLBB domain-containing protein [Chitinivibrionales bacterium]|nr:SLBB domain-containing protein [Chitinivibrionales bacterium]
MSNSFQSSPRLKKAYRVAVLMSLMLSYCQGILNAQTPADKFVIERYLKNNPGSENLKQMVKDSLNLIAHTGGRDTGAAGDTAKKQAPAVLPQEGASIYEQMLRNNLVVPDSLLNSLEVFGHALFSKKAGTSSLLSNQFPVPASYPIGPGDELIITLWGRINEEQRATVDRNGMVNITHLGPVSVAGLPFATMQKNIAEKLAGMEGVNVSVAMGELRSIQVYVAGEVAAPGLYMVSPLATVANALFAAGGVRKMGSLRSIMLLRGSRVAEKIDFYDFLLSGKNDGAVRLEPNDVVFVPIVKQMAAVAGNVRRNAIFELKPPATLKTLLDLAGGIAPGGFTNRIQIERMAQHSFKTVLDVTAAPSGALPEFDIQDGDVVKVFPVVVMDEGVVYMEGNVVRPGKYELKPGMRIADLVKSYSELLPETYFQYAVVERYEPPSYLARIIPFNLKTVLEENTSAENITLQSRDHVVIFASSYFEPDRGVSVDGAVTNPGKYKLLTNMKVKDLILQAGGLSENASPQRGELYRREYVDNKESTRKIEFCVQCAMESDSGSNLLLQKLDRVFVRTKLGWEEEKRITLKGEFVYPGTYILKEGETMGPLIARAGGFTDKAYRAASIFTRVSVQRLEQKRTEDYSRQLEMQMNNLSAELASKDNPEEARALLEQQKALLENLKKVQSLGRIVIDLNDPASYQNMVLEDGDELLVPRNFNTVSVLGEVFNPSTFNLDIRYSEARRYIQQSGGATENADQKNIYIIKANGSIVTRQMENVENYKLMAGDVVVVPQKLRYVNGYKIFLDTIDSITKVITAAVVVITFMTLIK